MTRTTCDCAAQSLCQIHGMPLGVISTDLRNFENGYTYVHYNSAKPRRAQILAVFETLKESFLTTTVVRKQQSFGRWLWRCAPVCNNSDLCCSWHQRRGRNSCNSDTAEKSYKKNTCVCYRAKSICPVTAVTEEDNMFPCIPFLLPPTLEHCAEAAL